MDGLACNQGDYLLLIAGLGGVMALLILAVTILRLVLTLVSILILNLIHILNLILLLIHSIIAGLNYFTV